jgi:hypothetical protein
MWSLSCLYKCAGGGAYVPVRFPKLRLVFFWSNCSSPSWSSPPVPILAYLWCLLERILQLLRKPAMLPRRMHCLWFLLRSGLINFSRGRGRPPAKKVIKSSEFIDDEAEERSFSSLVCFWNCLTVFIYFSCDNSDSDMKSVMSVNMSASKATTATPYVFSLASAISISSTYMFSAILEVVPLLKLSSLPDRLRKLMKSAWPLLFIHVFRGCIIFQLRWFRRWYEEHQECD